MKMRTISLLLPISQVRWLLRVLPVAVLLTTIVACANTGANYRPIIDAKGGSVDMNKFETDLRDCQQYANQVTGAAGQAAAGAAVGAIFGAILASAAGKNYDRGATTRVGAVTGAAAGAVQGETDQRDIIRRCLGGRGYSVLQ